MDYSGLVYDEPPLTFDQRYFFLQNTRKGIINWVREAFLDFFPPKRLKNHISFLGYDFNKIISLWVGGGGVINMHNIYPCL